MRIPERPIIYEINTAVFLRNLSQKYRRPITLKNAPTSEWDELGKLPIDAVWLMGVWQRSPLGRQMALQNSDDYQKILPELEPTDVLGSAYCVFDYKVDENFGGPEGLAKARTRLAKHNIGLILDFVPNHTALDHPWTKKHPEYFIHGDENDIAHNPKDFFQTTGGIIARGKDPNYDPWTDVAQLNAFAPAFRQAAIGTLLKIAKQCDGVRCDMAMLMCNGVFGSTWGERAGQAPDAEFWPEIIDGVRASEPNFLFLAEVYWDMQANLLDQGFDLCYDKDFYDVLRHGSAAKIRRHLEKVKPMQKNLLRFLENHDEERSAHLFEEGQQKAAAVILTMLEGARLYLEGQMHGYKTRIPVQLNRGPDQEPDKELYKFYQTIFGIVSELNLRDAQWQLLKTRTIFGLPSHNLLAWTWQLNEKVYLVVVNYNHKSAAGNIPLKHSLSSASYILSSGFNSSKTLKFGRNWNKIQLGPWGYAILEID